MHRHNLAAQLNTNSQSRIQCCGSVNIYLFRIRIHNSKLRIRIREANELRIRKQCTTSWNQQYNVAHHTYKKIEKLFLSMVSTETHCSLPKQQNSVYEFEAYLLENPLEHLH